MARYRTTISSSMSAPEAFAYMAAFENVADWDPGVRSAKRLTEGSPRLGTRFDVEASFMGRGLPLRYEITRFEEDSTFVLTAEAPTLRSVDTVTVVAEGSGSRVTYDADLVLKGVFKVFDPSLRLAFRSIGNKARDGLRRVLNP
ncbi:MAG: SRPBCC family protein [Ilumatobacteraceae bacterium]